MLDYLSNAQGAMQNLYQIKQAGNWWPRKSLGNCSLLLKSVGGNLKGTVIAAMVSDELTDAATQMTALFPFMKQLVTSGKYDVTGDDGKNEKHKVNLLNASERYYIANEVVSRFGSHQHQPGSQGNSEKNHLQRTGDVPRRLHHLPQASRSFSR